MPGLYKELYDIRTRLEHHYHDMQDIEFTIENQKLYMLQCRNGKRTGTAALNMAMDMLHEKLIDEVTAVTRVEPAQLDELLHPIIDPAAEKDAKAILSGLPAGPGGAVRQDRAHFRGCRRVGRPRREGDSGPRRDQSRRTSKACARPRASSPPAAA